jgi:3'-phosphoadenosine 5'-phosphosulfate sulfotransferase (PAPS reductase)/FAD synthetase
MTFIYPLPSKPYRFPDGPVAIQFSGGRTSGYMLWHILDVHDGQLPADAHVLFQNTGREMPETLAFVEECANRWNVPITWVEFDREDGFCVVGPGTNRPASTHGEPFEALRDLRGFLPNRVARFCTQELKVRPAKKWMLWGGYAHWTSVIGFRADEKSRVISRRAQKSKERWTCTFPLFEAGVTRRHVATWWAGQPFDLNLPTVSGKTPLGNCDGCFLKSEKARTFLARYYPDRARWWAEMEGRTGGSFHKDITWDQLIAFAEAQSDWVFDAECDAPCDADFGGCHD